MRRLPIRLSTPWTPLFKFGLPLAWIAACIGLVVAVQLAEEPVPIADVLAFISAIPLVLWYSVGIVQVHQQGSVLVISNYFREERIPAEQIEFVTRFWWARPGPVTIRFRQPTSFGRTVSFLPEESVLSILGFWWLDQETVEHLRQLASRAPERMP